MKLQGIKKRHGIEVPENTHKEVIRLLKKLKKKRVIIFEYDDSPEDMEVLRQLERIAGNCGLCCIHSHYRFFLFYKEKEHIVKRKKK